MAGLSLTFAAVLAAFLTAARCEYVEPMYLDYLFSNGRGDEAKELLGVPKLNLTYENGDPRYNKDLFQGDLLLTKEQEEMARQGINFKDNPQYRWDGKVPYYISPDFSSDSASKIRSAIGVMNRYFPRCLQWSPWKQGDVDYIYIHPGDGCYTTLGKTGGQQLLNLEDPDCIDQGTILHEMDHCMGMGHEHNRPDRDNYIHVLKNNLKEEWKDQFDKESEDLVYIGGDYDFYSIMHYAMYHPDVTVRPGLRTFEILHNPGSYDENRIGNNPEFTRIDKLKLLDMYDCDKSGV